MVGYEDVLTKVRHDLALKKADMSDHLVKAELDKCHADARRRIMSEGK